MEIDTNKMVQILQAEEPLTVFDIIDDYSGKVKLTAMFVLPELSEQVEKFAKELLKIK